jgi:hypothetical protein
VRVNPSSARTTLPEQGASSASAQIAAYELDDEPLIVGP